MKRILIFVGLLALVVGAAYAQGLTTGTLEGVIADSDGSPIEDAVVTAAGPQAVQTTTTGPRGRYRIVGLPPGEYSVKAEASGYATMVQSDVTVSINQKTQLPFSLNKGITEEVTVTSQAPLVDMKSTSTGTSVRIDDFAPYVPLGRNLVSVFTIAPGVTDGGTLGSVNSSISGSSGLENAYFVDGVNITNSGYGALGAYSIEYGSLGTGVTYDFLEEVQVKTGGFEAEFGQAGGGVVNTVVRSGTNDFGFDISFYEDPASLEGTFGERALEPNVVNTEETLRRDIALTAGGPILADKLFYFAAYNPITLEREFRLTSGDSTTRYFLEDTNNDGLICDGSGTCFDEASGTSILDPGAADTPTSFAVGDTISGGRVPGSVTRERSIDNYAAKVSWFANPNHKIEVTGFGDPSDGEVGPQSPTTFLRNLTNSIGIPDPAAGATGLDFGGDQIAVKYQGVWTSNFFTEVQFSQKENNFDETGPGTTFRGFFDEDSSNSFGGAGFFTTTSDEVTQINFKNTHVLGTLELSYGYQSEDIEWAQGRNYSGPTYMTIFPNLVEDDTGATGFSAACTTFAVDDPACYTRFDSATGASVTVTGLSTPDPSDDIYDVTRTDYIPAGDPTDAEETNFFVQASWDVVPSVTVRAGLRFTEQELTGSGNITLPICELGDGSTVGGCSTTLTGQSYEFDQEVAPRIGVSWDVLNDGRHKLFANYGEYFQRVPSDLAVRAFSNEVGVTSEEFVDANLSIPILNADCGIDTDNDGLFDATVPCHQSDSVQGLAGGGSIILDGTQQDPNSDVFAALHGLNTLASSKATKLPYTKEMLAGWAWEINDYTGIELRLIHRELGRVLEDIQFASNEQTWNLFRNSTFGLGASVLGAPCDPDEPGACGPFPGHGIGAFGAYVFANVGDNVNTTLFPTPERDYDAVEFVFNRRFHNGWMAYANYRYAELKGNYEGSFRNDNGQSDPFLTSLFDFPLASATDSNLTSDANGDGVLDNDFDTFIISPTMQGQFTAGPLNTDRAHIINAFVSKQFDFGLNVGGRMSVRSGQPRFPLFAHPAYRNSGEVPGFNPVYWWRVEVDTDADGETNGRGIYTSANTDPATIIGNTSIDYDGDGTNDEIIAFGGDTRARLYSYDVVKRDFFGRTATQLTFDVSLSYDIELRDGESKLTLLMDIFNLFDDNDALTFVDTVETRPGSADPDFLKALTFQTPRNVRLGAKFTW